MLLAPTKLKNSVNDDSDDETEDDGFEQAKKKLRKSVLIKKKWRKSSMKIDLPQWTPGDDKIEELKAKQLSPTTFFELFFDGELFDLMVEETNFFFFLFYFYLYIYPPDSQESDGGAIHRVRNYPDLLPEMPRYCCPLVI